MREIVAELKLIRLALERLAPEPPKESDAPEPCTHPEESRIDFGVTLGVPDWQCRLCGFRTVVEAPHA